MIVKEVVQLARELETYDRLRDGLLKTDEGKFALIYGKDLVGTFPTEMDAVTEGYGRFGKVPFLVKQIVELEAPKPLVSNLLDV